ncbi:MAG: universal stress protein [Gammaproteobacteria bacterium]|nr:MAG: universal stress protein [Gammaproteobacteria bacterium]
MQRILVALDATAHSEAILNAAASIAESLQAELVGMFIEDIDLLRMVELPVIHEIGFATASRRVLSKEIVSRSMKARAGRASAHLISIAEKHQLQFSFRVARGQMLEEVLAEASENDVVAIGLHTRQQRLIVSSGVVQQSKCSVLLLHHTRVSGASVIVLYDGSTEANVSIRLGKKLAVARKNRMVIVLLSDQDKTKALQERAAELLGDDVEVSYRSLAPQHTGELAMLLRQAQCRLLLVPAGFIGKEGMLDVEQFGQFVCPVLVVRP